MDLIIELGTCKTALEQIERLAIAGNATVLINGQRMTPERAIKLIASWTQRGVTANEILLCHPAEAI